LIKGTARKILSPIKRLLGKGVSAETEKSSPCAVRTEAVWSIAIYTGDSPFHWASPESINNPVLTRKDVTDVPAAFVADPFLLSVDGIFHMFFEVKNRRTNKGEIALASSKNGIEWSYQQIVLAEPFHLSYPYVFQSGGDYYMTPESHRSKSIRLYRALEFPTRWTFVATLLAGHPFVDPSVFHYHDKWWLFTGTSPDEKHDTLRLFYSDGLTGPWREHRQSPIIEGNARIARPGGRVLVLKDRIIRYAQDCYPVYGSQLRAFEITALGSKTYREREVVEEPILKANGSGWNASGMHHIDPYALADGRWLACVDGWSRVEVQPGA
jgi:hypothetical protein